MIITKDIIFQQFANKVTAFQRREIDLWLKSKENQECYYRWLEEWEMQQAIYTPNTDKDLMIYQDFIRQNPVGGDKAVEESTVVPGSNWPIYGKWVASVLLVASVAILLLQHQIRYQSYTTEAGEQKSFVLPDGSHVTLLERSSVQFPRWGFQGGLREVQLAGEARFAVEHTPEDHPFVVKTERDFEVVVLGTEFSVEVREKMATVALKKGKVRVDYQVDNTHKEMLMAPGELVMFKGDQPPVKSIESSNQSIWDQKRFVFDHLSLTEVGKMLEDTYGVQVEIYNESLGNRRLMGSFMANNLDELLQTMSELLEVEVVRDEKKIIFKE
ncbi:ferric-dicitrate binding protein FerR (iron transport regulator) [Dyadobacter jejuensis]|uniref:Ferric-dicitrate binding protein FerR (Iron transport regulator) n=1 Tax=Dyadobacter jejuensis TaxID=1082580 RepID=A0A316B764_9BACT|nr:FecR domain-containing protein [Dyadobacter jejuensis]PWJ58447.1 ferric-dicitrate binding protein FerR (iron transport regulator) [Dyadobacter jejuensis]